MRGFPWFLAAMFVVPAASWGQPQAQNQPQTSATASGAAADTSTAPAPQQDSLAEAARKAREQKKDAPKTAKVFTNDNLPTQGGISTVGKSSEPAATDSSASAAPAADGEKAWRDRFAKLRDKLAQDQADYDVMQRELGVLDVQNYSDPVKAMQQEMTRSDINQKTADIAAKSKQIDADKQAIADAEDDLRKAGGDSGWSR